MGDMYSLGALVEPLCLWYEDNKRSMPWRDSATPYHVWISEIMLQQTRIEAVKAYYDRFIKRLPDVERLAAVPEEELLKLWEGLGYYNRARNLKKAATLLVEHYEGKLPMSYDLLLELPGIGSYTAGAIASIAYGIPVPAVDGNVLRLVMRFLACRDDIAKMAVRKKLERSLMAVIPHDQPGTFNQALMELGETICIPGGAPLCGRCPLLSLCEGRKNGMEQILPVKQVKKARRIENKTVLVFEKDRKICITRRPESGLLARMWEFPMLEGKKSFSQIETWLQEQGIVPKQITRMGSAKHIFSHIEWHMTGYRMGLSKDMPPGLLPDAVWCSRSSLSDTYAIPTAFRFFLEQIIGKKVEK
jgi:A/G-specific adenine glycosylase